MKISYTLSGKEYIAIGECAAKFGVDMDKMLADSEVKEGIVSVSVHATEDNNVVLEIEYAPNFVVALCGIVSKNARNIGALITCIQSAATLAGSLIDSIKEDVKAAYVKETVKSAAKKPADTAIHIISMMRVR